MEWLITLKRNTPLEEVDQLLKANGCEREDNPPIPLDNDEEVISVSGPPDLSQKLKTEELIVKVSPNSRITLF